MFYKILDDVYLVDCQRTMSYIV